jgi:hypothetical protein
MVRLLLLQWRVLPPPVHVPSEPTHAGEPAQQIGIARWRSQAARVVLVRIKDWAARPITSGDQNA